MRRADPVIEFVGLPGAGKSTITAALPPEWTRSRRIEPPALPLSRRLAFYRAALPFMLSLRPLRRGDARRLARLASELRFYEAGVPGPLVIDQGMVQKLWSILFGRRGYSRPALERLMAALAPTAPGLLVVLGTTPEVAAERLAARAGGNARLQKLPPGEMQAGLAEGQALYALLLDLHRRHCGTAVLELSGLDPVAASAARVVSAVAGLTPVSAPATAS